SSTSRGIHICGRRPTRDGAHRLRGRPASVDAACRRPRSRRPRARWTGAVGWRPEPVAPRLAPESPFEFFKHRLAGYERVTTAGIGSPTTRPVAPGHNVGRCPSVVVEAGDGRLDVNNRGCHVEILYHA